MDKKMTVLLKPQISLLLAVCLMAGFAGQAAAEANYAATFLQNGAGGRATGMGDNFTAVASGPFGYLYNPAGLALEETPAIGFQQDGTGEWVQHSMLAGYLPLGPGALAAGLNYYSYGTFEVLDSFGQTTGESLSPKDALFNLGYGMRLGSQWRAGINAGIFSEDLGTVKYSGVTFDLGGSFDPAPDWSLSAVFKNVGSNVNEDYQLPSSFRMAGAFWTIERRLLIDAEMDMVFGSVAEFGMGAEFRVWDWLDARLGFKVPLSSNKNTGVENLVAGLGFNLNQFGVDLSFMGRGDFGAELGIALEYYFSRPRVKAIAESKSTKTEAEAGERPRYVYKPDPGTRRIQGEDREQAEYHYKAGQEYEKYGQIIDAIVEYKAALKILPEFRLAQDALTKAKAEARAQALAKEKAGNAGTPQGNTSLQQLIRKYYNKGEKAYQAKEYTEAIKQLQLVLELTTQHRKATELLQKAKSALHSEMSALTRQAANAREQGDIVGEVDAYQKMLDLDPDNKTAKANLADAKKRIPKEVDRLYRKGLDLYARQDLRKALKAFEDLLKLQPDHVKAQDAVDNIKEKLLQTGQ